MFNKILVPLDGSELAAKILPDVSAVAKCMGSQVTLLHVCYFPTLAVMESLAPMMAKEAEAQGGERVCHLLGEGG